MVAKLEARLTLPVMADAPAQPPRAIGYTHCGFRATSMSRYQIKLPGGEVAISSMDARHREERNGEVLAFTIAGRCFSWWSTEQLSRRAARKERARIEQQERWAKATQSNPPSDTSS